MDGWPNYVKYGDDPPLMDTCYKEVSHYDDSKKQLNHRRKNQNTTSHSSKTFHSCNLSYPQNSKPKYLSTYLSTYCTSILHCDQQVYCICILLTWFWRDHVGHLEEEKDEYGEDTQCNDDRLRTSRPAANVRAMDGAPQPQVDHLGKQLKIVNCSFPVLVARTQ